MNGWPVVVALVVLALPAGPEARRPRPSCRVAPPRHDGAGGVLAVLGRVPRRWLGRRPDAAAERWWGAALVAASVSALLFPWFVPVPPVVVAGLRRLRSAQARRRRDVEVEAALPEVLELVAVAIRAGGTVPAAMTLVAQRGPTVARAGFRAVLERMAAGTSFLDAVDDLPRLLGDGYRPLCAALLSAERDGSPLLSVVAQLAQDAHEARRRMAETRGRQVPVRLLLPLVCCTLPAVLVVTVVPLALVGTGVLG